MNTGNTRKLNYPRALNVPKEVSNNAAAPDTSKDETIEHLRMELAERDMKVQRLRQEKLGLLLKCFIEVSNLHDSLRQVTSNGSKHKQVESKVMLNNAKAPVAIQVEDSDVEDDLIVKLTGRLEQVFESARQLK